MKMVRSNAFALVAMAVGSSVHAPPLASSNKGAAPQAAISVRPE